MHIYQDDMLCMIFVFLNVECTRKCPKIIIFLVKIGLQGKNKEKKNLPVNVPGIRQVLNILSNW